MAGIRRAVVSARTAPGLPSRRDAAGRDVPAAADHGDAALPPMAPPFGPFGPPVGPPPAAPGGQSGNAKWIVVGVLAVAAVAIAAFLLLGGDSKKNNAAAPPRARSELLVVVVLVEVVEQLVVVTSSSSSSSGATGGRASAQTAQNPADVSPDLKDGTFSPDNISPSPCGQPNTGSQFPPVIDVGSAAENTASTVFFQEEVSTYKDAATTSPGVRPGKQSVSCTQGTTSNGTAITLSAPKDVSSESERS